MIEIHRHGKTVKFDDTGVDRRRPGLVRSPLYEGSFYEERFLEHVRSLGRPGVYVDVGSFIGTHALFFAVLCESTHVYAFEPRPTPRQELERNLAANAADAKVTVCSAGAASRHKTVSAVLDGITVEFDCVPLDDVVTQPAVAVIKIDVEGMEADVLAGATRILRESRPVIFAEAHEEHERKAIEEHLRPFGYVRTGRAFNATPTYEFMHLTDPGLPAALTELIAHRDRRAAVANRLRARVAALEADKQALAAKKQALQSKVEGLESVLEDTLRRLRAARGSLAFRLGRATTVALRESGGAPWRIPGRWAEVFGGSDDVLDRIEKESRRTR